MGDRRYVVKNTSGEYLSREPPYVGPVGWVRGQQYAWRFTENGARWTASGLGARVVRLGAPPNHDRLDTARFRGALAEIAAFASETTGAADEDILHIVQIANGALKGARTSPTSSKVQE